MFKVDSPCLPPCDAIYPFFERFLLSLCCRCAVSLGVIAPLQARPGPPSERFCCCSPLLFSRCQMMNLAFLPDLSALAILIGILLLLRRSVSEQRTNLWLLGLFITLVESMAHIFYAPAGIPAAFLHVVVINCYILAGLVFTWAGA